MRRSNGLRSTGVRWSGLALRGIGVLLFLWILSTIDLAQCWNIVRAASALPLIVSFLLSLPIFLLKAYRWHLLVRAAGVQESFLASFKIYTIGLFFGVVTPGRAGEALKIPHLRRRGLSSLSSVLLTVLDRLFDVFWVGVIAVPMVLWQWGIVGGGILGVLSMGSVLLGWFLLRGIIIPPEIRSALRHRWWSLHGLTLLNWFVYFLQLFLLARSLMITVPFIPFVGILAIVGILSLLPIAPAGLGTRDAALLFFLAPSAIAPERILAFSFSIFVLTLFASTVGAALWLIPLHRKRSTHAGEEGILQGHADESVHDR